MEQYSVLMSLYFREKPNFVRQAIESMLHQTIAPSDFVIVCDGELTNDLYGVLEYFCNQWPSLFQIVKLKSNRGLGLALKEGLGYCKHELVARMDADDIAAPDRMEKLLIALEQNPDVSVVGGQISEFYDDPQQVVDYRIVPEQFDEIKKRMAVRNPMNHVTVVFRKSHVLKAGSYCDISGFEDYHLWAQMIDSGYKMINISDNCCNVRVDQNMHGRRSGWKYFKSTWEMEQFLLDKKLINWAEFVRNVTIRFFGTVVCPDSLKRVLFKKFMRKKTIG